MKQSRYRDIKDMNNKQVEEVLKAIIAGKYSWACVLILRFNGYDPLHYIPYRTYIRLLKDNYQMDRTGVN
ncbi:HetP family heterocyst commitment protein [Calothrix sp. UHCC 0171]|uniref:HetP family heterocyst commitment protein n=1 Tax=Calothrix sp. UHCC 0171 TaxID=3110245 RepID=UPI002B1F2AD6|nr:HetP family heterocyst commitment protein [Calothrix sp. UHCC 0171]MEA5570803.1 HetP family heterocyst commitment protein [Calothrix sp. UHCC 0171]